MSNTDPATFAIVPRPVRLEPQTGVFTLSAATSIVADASASSQARNLNKWLSKAMGFRSGTDRDGTRITLRLDPALTQLGREGYMLEVSPTDINMRATTLTGLFYAVGTLRQLFPLDIYSATPTRGTVWQIPCVKIADRPRFGWRGLMLDVSRHYLTASDIKKLLDLMALHKLNVFHWHLTDDQGWRLQIKKYPKLTQLGAKRKSTLLGHEDSRPRRYDDKPHEGFYSPDEVRAIIGYAAERQITVIPEIAMPGHMQAAIAAYPELGNSALRLEPREHWGVSNHILNPDPTTIRFFENVLAEVIDMFPSKYIHIGGHEAAKLEWSESRAVQAQMYALDLKSDAALQHWFIRQINDFVAAQGRQLLGWDALLIGGAPDGATITACSIQEGIRAIKAGHNVVMTPQQYLSFDQYQSAETATEPLAAGGCTTLETSYSYEPIPSELSAEEAKRILGVEATLWTEYIPSLSHAEYMLFPRAAALAETAWSVPGAKHFQDFSARLDIHLKRLSLLGVNYRQTDLSIA